MIWWVTSKISKSAFALFKHPIQVDYWPVPGSRSVGTSGVWGPLLFSIRNYSSPARFFDRPHWPRAWNRLVDYHIKSDKGEKNNMKFTFCHIFHIARMSGLAFWRYFLESDLSRLPLSCLYMNGLAINNYIIVHRDGMTLVFMVPAKSQLPISTQWLLRASY